MTKKMRFAFTAFVALSFVVSARADLLYWMVDDTKLSDSFKGYSYAGVAVAGTEDHLIITDENGAPLGGWKVKSSAFDGEGQFADFGSYGAGSSYLIELFNEGNDCIGVSQTLTYDQLAPYIGKGGVGKDALTPWNGGAFTVPEPTSGLLTLCGLALLALRRKRV